VEAGATIVLGLTPLHFDPTFDRQALKRRVEIRDFVYGSLIDISPATLYPVAPAGKKALFARGLDERRFGKSGGLSYGSVHGGSDSYYERWP
jgi:hypothetical protein